jgi:putative Mn2+ efflux pump MntP
MGWWEILLVAFGLAMDAFAVAICKGVSLKTASVRHGIAIGATFGGFQFVMPVLGFLLGSAFAEVADGYDHWIAFGLLGFIGVKMIFESCRSETEACDLALKPGELLGLGLATSIDALAVGLSFSFLGVAIWLPAIVIGAVAFAMSFAGFLLGRRIGAFVRRRAGVFGGAILVFLGVRILLLGLGILS